MLGTWVFQSKSRKKNAKPFDSALKIIITMDNTTKYDNQIDWPKKREKEMKINII